MLAHAEKPTDADNDIRDLTRLIQDHFANIANFLVAFIVHIYPDEFGRPPLSLMVHGRSIVCIGPRRGSRLCGDRASHQRGSQ